MLSNKHFISLKDTPKEDIMKLIETGLSFREVLERPVKKVPTLSGKNILNLFFENSTRTKMSFELAEKRLSADVTNFSASSSSLNKGETFRDTVQNIQVMKIDCIVMRHPSPGSSLQLTNFVDSIIVNGGDGCHEHPTQAMLDVMSLYEKFETFKNLKVAIIGDILHSRVALSNIYALKTLGVEVTLCGPPHLIPIGIQDLGVDINYNVDEVLEWADAINVLRIQRERMGIGLIPSVREYREVFGITSKRIENLKKEIVIMHPGPINRGVELDGDVADSDNSIILNQVLNGVAMRMSILYHLLSEGDTIND
ncbi:MAG: aspartate carbamoyltransferase [Candidatus Marinimicrobia bacterium]|nr:aspartate carbamoyltransferase [Candidatus Neomarinimicrobiota bacterium]|tara:strand:+ start:4047 stop:4979 length:933 start_codon:yes stop_codon:yes gene_type:complete